jgi:hypothetical protein
MPSQKLVIPERTLVQSKDLDSDGHQGRFKYQIIPNLEFFSMRLLKRKVKLSP